MSADFDFSSSRTGTRLFNFSSRNSRQERELFLVPENSWREGGENNFHENFGNCREMTGKSWCLHCIIKNLIYKGESVCVCVCVYVCPAACRRTYTTNHPKIWHRLLISPWLSTEPGGDPKC